MKRKITISILLIGMFVLLTSAIAFANENDTFSLSTEQATVISGDTVVVTLSNTANSAGVEGVLKYNPDVFTYKDVTFLGVAAEKNTDYGSVKNYASGQVRFSIVGDVAQGTTGDWAKFTFEVKDGFIGGTKMYLSNLKVADLSAKLHEIENGTPLDIEVKGTGIDEASVSLGESITVNYYVTLLESNKDATMTFTMNEKSISVEGTLVSGDEYKFAFEGVSPQCMTDTIVAQLMDGTEVIDTYDAFTVRSYCDKLLASNADTLGISNEKFVAMKTLIADMLEYGAMSQNYRNYKTDTLANQNIVDQSEFVALSEAWKVAPANTGDNVKIVAGGVWFANVNKLYLKFATADVSDTTLVYNGQTYTSEDFELVEGNTYIFYTDAIAPTEFNVAKTAEFKYGGSTEATISYCVYNYIFAKQGLDTKMGKLARALYNYGESAVAYTELQ